MKPNPLHIVGDTEGVRSLSGSRASHRANLRCLDLSASIRARQPSRNYLALTRNPDLAPPSRFEPTVKGIDDVVI